MVASWNCHSPEIALAALAYRNTLPKSARPGCNRSRHGVAAGVSLAS